MAVKVEFTGSAEQLVREMNKLYQENLKLHEQYQNLKKNSKKTHDDMLSGLRDVARGTTESAKQYLSLNTVVGMLGDPQANDAQISPPTRPLATPSR